MKENEKIVKDNLRKKRLNSQKTIISNDQKALSYKTLIVGNAVRLSRSNEVDLWVQEINLSSGAKLQSILSQS